MRQPLAGECAARRDVLEAVPFVGGYGVDLGLLIDVTERFGTAGLVQCDLGERVHRNRPLAELGVQALAILQLALVRAGLCEANAAAFGWTTHLVRPAAETGRRDAGRAAPAGGGARPPQDAREGPVQRSASTSATSSPRAPSGSAQARSSPTEPTRVR